MSMLEVKDLNVFYGGIQAIRSLNIHVDQGEIVSIIGANGAGKSTLMRSIAGDQKYIGSIIFKGEHIPKDSCDVVRKGISLVPGAQDFPRSDGYGKPPGWSLCP
jgi:branched-chain amino acid transport system ATP-binding protein